MPAEATVPHAQANAPLLECRALDVCVESRTLVRGLNLKVGAFVLSTLLGARPVHCALACLDARHRRLLGFQKTCRSSTART